VVSTFKMAVSAVLKYGGAAYRENDDPSPDGRGP
jgi:hypothetical protein